jgi:UDP-3-O-[3-hydroxymyristoyl] N-acetylglucosamine deacetylase
LGIGNSLILEDFLQRTIAKTVSFNGVGMHSGRNAVVRLMPAQADSGIRFHRLDGKASNNWIPALWDRVIRYPACTCIANEEGASVRTVEHLMAACYATGIDNLDVEIEGEEVPILDGSASPIVELIESVGTVELDGKRKVLEVLKPVFYENEHRKFAFEPYDGFAVDINIYPGEYGHMPWVGDMTPEIFRKEIVSAKAWGRLKDIWLPKIVGNFLKNPVLRGAGLNTAVVYAFGRPINPSGLHHPNDMVRHKVLDILGDLQLVGGEIKGKITCHSSAHVTNHAGMAALFSTEDAWRWQNA